MSEEPTAPPPAPELPPPAFDGPPPVAPAPGGVPAAPKKQPGRWRLFLVLGAIVVFLGVVLFAVRNNAEVDDLKVGDCFTIPDGTTVKTVEKLPCTQTHNAEVVFVGDYTGTTYPISLSLQSFARDNCLPASDAYVGRSVDDDPALSIGYFSPTRDSWDAGDRTISCYLSQPDESAMTESLKK
jgi:hypothetical protein